MVVILEEIIESFQILCYIYFVLDVNEEQKYKKREKKLKIDIIC